MRLEIFEEKKWPIHLSHETVWISLTIALLINSLALEKALDYPANSQKNLVSDWQTLPILSISTEVQSCQSLGLTNLVQKDWLGTEQGCDCRHLDRSDLAPLSTGFCSKTVKAAGCYRVDPQTPSPDLGNLGGFYLCAKRSTTNFIDAQRPLASGECPSGLNLCNPAAKIDNRVCASTIEECPINDIKFFDSI